MGGSGRGVGCEWEESGRAVGCEWEGVGGELDVSGREWEGSWV